MSSWNKFCFAGGMVEMTVSLPGAPNTWPYAYDEFDAETAPNQILNGLPPRGDHQRRVEYPQRALPPGQRLSRDTCPGESRPGPIHFDGTYVGRSAPEIDIFEAQVRNKISR
ncbi:glycoside hydrolase family 16 protein [Athelia psychrophila]|uniref:Glycoside hydrolase family 16 protein n=1 Tax=Athelia psychrophila TaxID=1759441 RepID=A0A167T4P5_9AGAM|nr:glycoside hydrolase family 16 protein [Fibularhizoctonia sp. CBS 109695]